MFQKAPRRSLAGDAYGAIREDILRGRLRPGTPLSRRRLARKLGMSIVPIAEALKRLEEAGLVESRPRAGTRVRIPTEKDIRELYELREGLEAQSARLFAQRATPASRLELCQLAVALDALFNSLASRSDEAAFRFKVHSHHVRFHMKIAEHADSQLVRQIIERSHVLILNWLFDLAGRRSALPPDFHRQLAEALVSGDVERADTAMRAHVRYGLAEISGRIGALAVSEWRERRRHPEKKASKRYPH
jgi:DNA-binding GntR family transcriptional regulator